LPEARVVVLARQAIDRVAGAETVCVSGAYEAAAELLAARQAGAAPLALVVDLGLLWPRHLGLLQVARKLEAEMLAFGTAVAGLDAEQLAGLRLVSRASLPEALAQFARRQGQPVHAEEPAPPEDFAPIEEPMRAEESLRGLSEPRTEVSGLSEPRANESVPPKPADAAARDGRRAKTSPTASPPAARLVPAKQPPLDEDEPLVQPPSLDLTLESGDGEGASSARPPTARATQPSSLLTPEELSALLGEEDP
jgi:hypothetical protein